MPFRIAIAGWSLVLACTSFAGCATNATSGAHKTFMAKCEESANTEQERSECAWKNAERMASGR
jgi:hypothetical protein